MFVLYFVYFSTQSQIWQRFGKLEAQKYVVQKIRFFELTAKVKLKTDFKEVSIFIIFWLST